MKPNFSKEKIESIQINHGVIYLNYGEEDEMLLAPTRGGGEFVVERTIRDIDFDGKEGKTVGTRIIDEENASLKAVVLDMSIDTIKLALPGATLTANKITSGEMGVIPAADYLKNVTMFAETVGKKYKKITLFNAMADNGLKIAALPKAEGSIELSFAAHHAIGSASGIYSIEDVESIA